MTCSLPLTHLCAVAVCVYRFRDVRTTSLQVDASPQEVALALEALSAVGDVNVDRAPAATGGFVWLVTFLTNVGNQVTCGAK